MNLAELGWTPVFAASFERFAGCGFTPARIAQEQKLMYEVYGEWDELAAEVSGKLRHAARSRSDFPAVGDWVAVQARPEEGKATIHAVLPRKSAFSRTCSAEAFVLDLQW